MKTNHLITSPYPGDGDGNAIEHFFLLFSRISFITPDRRYVPVIEIVKQNGLMEFQKA